MFILTGTNELEMMLLKYRVWVGAPNVFICHYFILLNRCGLSTVLINVYKCSFRAFGFPFSSFTFLLGFAI